MVKEKDYIYVHVGTPGKYEFGFLKNLFLFIKFNWLLIIYINKL
jgi:hypothetical protein